jgi:hypothetical protein
MGQEDSISYLSITYTTLSELEKKLNSNGQAKEK